MTPLKKILARVDPGVASPSTREGVAREGVVEDQAHGLGLNATQVKDFSPLKGMPLTRLELDSTQVRDLELFKGMPLKVLHFVGTNVTDLTPLQGMELEVSA